MAKELSKHLAGCLCLTFACLGEVNFVVRRYLIHALILIGSAFAMSHEENILSG